MANALAVLDFPAIVERLAAAASTAYGEELARALTPSPDPHEVARRQALTAEVVALLDNAAEPPLDGIRDVRPAAAHAARGGALSTEALAHIAAAVGGGLRARAALEEERETAPLLAELAAAIEPGLAPLAKEIGRRVEEDGSDLRDNASPTLRKLRRELREGRHRVTEELRRLSRAPGLQEHLQEDFVAFRGGRPVLAVKLERAAQREGDRPRLLRLGSDALHRAVRGRRAEQPPVGGGGRRARGGRADPPRALRGRRRARGPPRRARRGHRSDRPGRGARHDLARLARHPGRDLGRGTPPRSASPVARPRDRRSHRSGSRRLRALVISGPNTGGKTVALKTLGLAALLHQSGLRPPAATAALPVFDEVLADIGDPQSIEMSLSTFSGHIENVRAILRAATGRSLVLVDELASGTDPVEGSALAQALLGRLAEQARLTVVTTHYPELKEWASATEGASNAATGPIPRRTRRSTGSCSAGRGPRTRCRPPSGSGSTSRSSPTRVRVSHPSACGSPSCWERPRRPSGRRWSSSRAPRRSGPRQEELVEQARERQAALEAEIERVRASAAGERELAVAEAERDLAAARAELKALREEIRVARRREQQVRRAPDRAPEAERERDRRLGAASTRAARAERALRSLDEPVVQQAPLAPGDPVEAPSAGVRGTIASIEGDEAEVIGQRGLRIRIALARLRPTRGGAEEEARRRLPCASSPAHAATSPTSSTCAGSGRRRRARPSARSSTRPRSPGSRASA